MKIYLIRHGRQCSRLCNANVDLCEEGYRQAELVGRRLEHAGIEKLYSSDLLRAVQTAETANRYWNVEHVIRPELREISFGDMEGLSDDVIAERFAEFKLRQNQMLEDLPYPGGECAGDVIQRAMPILLEIAQSGLNRVAVVIHGGVIRSVTAGILEMNLAKARLIGGSLENCSITELEYSPEKPFFVLERFNDYAHLEQEPELLRCHWAGQEN